MKYKKLLNWEHWSVYLFYIPILPYVLYESLKARHLCFFYSANPGIFHSGSGVESKYKTLQMIPPNYRPKTVWIPRDSASEHVLEIMGEADLHFPLIAKPDVGYRGYLVKLIENKDDLKAYTSKFHEIDFILQKYISYKNECGIFYTKKPSEQRGSITSMTLKKLPTVKGDGHSSLKELVLADERLAVYLDLFKTTHAEKLRQVIEEGREFQLSVVGNHSKGTQFLDGNDLIDEQLIESIDAVCQKIKGFNYGRLDIKYESLEGLKRGEGFKILEVNGIISEPTHVYDTSSKKSSYWNTLKEQVKHWGLLSDIAREQHALNNVAYHPFSDFIKDLFWLMKYSKKLKILNKL